MYNNYLIKLNTQEHKRKCGCQLVYYLQMHITAILKRNYKNVGNEYNKLHIPCRIYLTHNHKDNVFSQASLRKQVWDLVVQVMDLFEQSKLKAQKLRMSTLLQKPEFKQNYLAPIRTLPISDQCLLLQKVIAGETSLTELQTAATQLKQKAALKTAFAKLTNVESWDQAVDKFPAFATDDQLNQFLGIDIRKTIPKAFVSFCQRAKSYSADDASPASSIVVNCASVNVLVTEISVISGKMIRKANPSFEGAHLVITSHSENMESIAYTIKDINACSCLCMSSRRPTDNNEHMEAYFWKS